MTDVLHIKIRDVEAITLKKKSTIYALMKAGKFPQAKKSGGATLWLRSDVIAYMAGQEKWQPMEARPPKPAKPPPVAQARSAAGAPIGSIPPHKQDETARCYAEMERRGIDPNDSWAFSAIMNRILEQDEIAHAWDEFRARQAAEGPEAGPPGAAPLAKG